MKYRIIMSAAMACLISNTLTATTNEVVITATRIETPINQMATSVNAFTADEIDNNGPIAIPDLLQSLPGVSMSRSGGPGQATQIYLRGAKPQHTLVMIDGVRMNGQLDLTGYNMANLQMLDIDRIEILKGPQSPLYGTDAMAGVINIITKKGEGNPTPYYQLEGGSYGTWRAATGVEGGDDRVSYNASVSHYDRQGESVLKNNSENDGYENTTVATRVDVTPYDESELTLTVRYIDAAADYDDGFGTAHSTFRYDTEQLISRAQATCLLFNDLVETKAGISYLMMDRQEYGFASTYNADTIAADWANTVFLHDNHTFLFGLDGYYDDFMFDEGFGATEDNLSNIGAFGTYQVFPVEPWVVNIGARYDEHSDFNGEATYQASSAYTITTTGTKIKGSYGTGFKAPISYQLYVPVFGNPDLKPEESRGWEIGFEQTILSNRINVGSTYFQTDYDNLIDYDFISSSYGNIAQAATKGVEVYGTLIPINALRIRAGYTYLDNDDESGNSFSLKRPQHQIDTDITCAATERLHFTVYTGFIGSREDIGNAVMDSYVLVNLAARYQINDTVQIYGRIENLLDEDYETVAGYNTDDLSAYAGVKITL